MTSALIHSVLPHSFPILPTRHASSGLFTTSQNPKGQSPAPVCLTFPAHCSTQAFPLTVSSDGPPELAPGSFPWSAPSPRVHTHIGMPSSLLSVASPLTLPVPTMSLNGATSPDPTRTHCANVSLGEEGSREGGERAFWRKQAVQGVNQGGRCRTDRQRALCGKLFFFIFYFFRENPLTQLCL